MRKSILLVLLILAATGAAVGWLYSQPDKWQIEDRAKVEVGHEKLYPLLIEPKRWAAWSTWNDQDQDNLKRNYQGPDIGVGATEVWHYNGKDGITVITNTLEPEPGEQQQGEHKAVNIEYQVSAMQGAFLAMAKIELRPLDAKRTEVIWTASGDGGGITILKAIAQYGLWQMQSIHRGSLEKLQRLAPDIENQHD